MRWLPFLLLAVGCGFSSPGGMPADAPDADGPTSCTAWMPRGGHLRDVCSSPTNGVSWTVSGPGGTYNTDDGSYTGGAAPGGALVMIDDFQVRVVPVEVFTVVALATLRVVGKHPLLVLSWSTINVAGTIDVSSPRGVGPGAGANLTGCSLAHEGAGAVNAGGGGGAGFKIGGGRGGDGNGAVPNQGGGPASSIGPPRFLIRGGCPGGPGGTGANAGAGGDGGGAIQLTAKDSITITGTINAGGMGGQGAGSGANGAGGGGGGSGGFIGLDAPVVTAVAGSILAANGGGGGAGCDRDGVGANGEDGKTVNAFAAGGPGTSCTTIGTGADGGNGSARTSPGATVGASGLNGGGGGGGGYGYIFVWVPSFTKISGSLQTPVEDLVTTVETPP